MSGGGYYTKRHDKAVRDACQYLINHGYRHAEPRARSGEDADRGDIAGVPGFVIEVKTGEPKWKAWRDQLNAEVARETARTGVPCDGFVLWRPQGWTDPGLWWVMRPFGAEVARWRLDEGWEAA